MRPSRDEVLMDIAVLIAQRSTCPRKHVGAVVAREGRILVTGYNGAPAGMPHCEHNDPYEVNGCTMAVHAEANAVAYAARYGIDLSNSTIYTTLTPCLACAQLLINCGINRVVCSERYRDIIGVDLLKAAGLKVEIFERDE